VDVTSRLTHVLVEIGQEGDDVVLHFRLNFQNPRWVKSGFGFDLLQGLLRDPPQLRLGFTNGQFYLQPGLELVGGGPDLAHFRQSVALDQGAFPVSTIG